MESSVMSFSLTCAGHLRQQLLNFRPKNMFRLPFPELQGDQIYMAVLFWYLVKRDLFSVRYSTEAFFFFYQIPEQHGLVHQVGL